MLTKIVAADAQNFLLLVGRRAERRRRQRPSARRPCRISRVGTASILGPIAAAGRDREVHAADRAQHSVMVGDSVADDVNDLALLLESAPYRDHRREHDLALAMPVSSSIVMNSTPLQHPKHSRKLRVRHSPPSAAKSRSPSSRGPPSRWRSPCPMISSRNLRARSARACPTKRAEWITLPLMSCTPESAWQRDRSARGCDSDFDARMSEQERGSAGATV